MESYCCQISNTSIKRRAGHALLRDQINSNVERMVKSQPQVIYTLVDPRTDIVHYVGRTCNPKKRYTQHLSATRSKDVCTIEKETWTWELRALGLRPRMDIVETVEPPPITVLERECRWLFHYIQQRAPLTNIEAIARHHLVKAIRRSRANFLTAHVHSNVWYPLFCAQRLDLEELRRIEMESGRYKNFGLANAVGKRQRNK